jgi:GNAT superfamily N-acetyltransferase
MALGFKSDEIHRLIGFEEQGSLVLHNLSTSANVAAEKMPEQSKLAPTPEPPYVYQVNLNIPLSMVLKDMAPLTFPSLAKQNEAGSVKGQLVAVSALHQGKPVGLALAELNTQDHSAKLLSLFVTPDHRRQGIGTTLLTQIEKVIAHQGGNQLEIAFQSDWAHVPTIEHMLQKHGWSPPRAWMMLYKGTMQGIAEANWLDRCRLPDDFEIFPWAELTGDERKAIIKQQETEQWFPAKLTPFQEEDRIEFLNSVGLRYRNEVVGWMITHRIAPDTIQYTSLFVRKDLQRLGRAIPLLAASIKRQMASDIPRGVCQVQIETKRMVDCIRRRILPYQTSLRELRCSRIEFASLSQANQERLTA